VKLGDDIDVSERPRIRPVESCHICELIDIGNETDLAPWSAQNYLDELNTTGSIMLRAVVAGNVTGGFVVGRVVQGTARPDAEIYNIAVRPEYRRSRIGQALLDAFMEKCASAAVQGVWLEVRVSNEAAVCFYRKNGFQVHQTRPLFYRRPDEDAFVMHRTLTMQAS
jgi:[ribosomal protein S18]-alanine N-acetyltransferase